MARSRIASGLIIGASVLFATTVAAQEQLPNDNGLSTYYTAPRYRESESHPLRIAAYILHPVGWLLREGIFRPLSYFASSTETRRSVMGYREPFDYRQPECFTADDGIPDCHAIPPYNYDSGQPSVTDEVASEAGSLGETAKSEVYFPNVNFDFNKKDLNQLGKGQAMQIAEMLKASGATVKVVLQGHTDYVGSESYNQKLGMDRAEAVKAELVGLGVGADRLATVSFGESKPLYAEQQDWARALNRRVETRPEEELSAPAAN